MSLLPSPDNTAMHISTLFCIYKESQAFYIYPSFHSFLPTYGSRLYEPTNSTCMSLHRMSVQLMQQSPTTILYPYTWTMTWNRVFYIQVISNFYHCLHIAKGTQNEAFATASMYWILRIQIMTVFTNGIVDLETRNNTTQYWTIFGFTWYTANGYFMTTVQLQPGKSTSKDHSFIAWHTHDATVQVVWMDFTIAYCALCTALWAKLVSLFVAAKQQACCTSVPGTILYDSNTTATHITFILPVTGTKPSGYTESVHFCTEIGQSLSENMFSSLCSLSLLNFAAFCSHCKKL